MFPENKNKKIAQGMGSTRSVRLATRYEKARQDVGLFYVYYSKVIKKKGDNLKLSPILVTNYKPSAHAVAKMVASNQPYVLHHNLNTS